MSIHVCDACRGERKRENAECPVTKHTRRSTVKDLEVTAWYPAMQQYQPPIRLHITCRFNNGMPDSVHSIILYGNSEQVGLQLNKIAIHIRFSKNSSV